MQSKNKPRPTKAEALRIARVAQLDCVVCDEPGPSEVHEPEQGLWFVSMPLCPLCHRGPEGWHGTRKRWTLRRINELQAIDKTNRRLENE
jgi:hypothetical protein